MELSYFEQRLTVSGISGFGHLGFRHDIVGVGVLLSSIVYLIQVVGYQNPDLLYGGRVGPGFSPDYYNNASYNLFGYQFDPIIAIAAVGVVVGALQLIAAFGLCCTSQRSWIATGWVLGHVVLFLMAVVAISLGFYYEVYLYLYPPNGIYYDANTGFLAPNGNPRLNGYSGAYYPNAFGTPYNRYNSGLLNLFGYNGYYNPAGQAYLAFLGIDIIFLLAAMILVGCTATAHRDRYDTDSYHSKLYRSPSRQVTSGSTTRM